MVLNKVRSLLAAQLGIDENKITEKTRLSDHLQADSLDMIEFSLTLESEFGLLIEDAALRRFSSVGDIADYLEQRMRRDRF